jgi:hypothetical protein
MTAKNRVSVPGFPLAPVTISWRFAGKKRYGVKWSYRKVLEREFG